MRKFYFVLFAAVGFCCSLSAQLTAGIEWSKVIAADYPDVGSINKTFDGGYVVAKRVGINGAVLKLDASGNQEWEREYQLGGFVIVQSVIQTEDGGYILTGDNSVQFPGKAWVSKLSSTGETEWENSYIGEGVGSGFANHILATDDGGFLIGGYANTFGTNGGMDYWMIKINASGDVLWQKLHGDPDTEYLNNIQQTSDGGFIMIGRSTSLENPFDWDFLVIKTDSEGELEWKKRLGGSAVDQGMAVTENSAGEFIVAGNSQSTDGDISNPKGLTDFWVVKLDASGNIIWDKSFGGTNVENVTRISPYLNQGFIITGLTYSEDGDLNGNNGEGDSWVIRIDESGNLIWQENYGGSATDYFSRLVVNEDGTILFAGLTTSTDGDLSEHNGETGIWFIKLGLVCATPAPVALEIQYFDEGETLADLDISAEGEIIWYADETLTVQLPSTTLLVDDTTYYATQIIEGCESQSISITVDDDFLHIDENNLNSFTIYPNPVNDILNIAGKENVESAQIYDFTGKIILSLNSKQQTPSTINLSGLKSGTYLLKIVSEKSIYTFKVIKK